MLLGTTTVAFADTTNDMHKAPNRYYYTTEYTYRGSHSFTVTKAQAASMATYDACIRAFVTGIASGLGSVQLYALLVGTIEGGFYKTPNSAPGVYYVNVYDAAKYKNDRLTGKKTSSQRGVKYAITHNGVTKETVYWY